MVLLWAPLLLPTGCSPNLEEARSFKILFDHYREYEEVTAISFPPGLVGLFLNGEDRELAELKTLMQELSSFRLLSVKGSGHDTQTASELREAVSNYTLRNRFEDLFRMQTAEEDIFIRIQEKDGSIREAILMFGSGEEFFVIDLRGNIEPEHFTSLAQSGFLTELAQLSEVDI